MAAPRVPTTLAAALGVILFAAGCGARTGIDDGSLEASSRADAAPDAPLPGCGSSTCAGCCTDAGACVPGTAQSACGTGGALCQSCDPSFDVCNPNGDPTVTGVVCYEPCPLRTCGGCCTPDGTCVEGTADTACGGPSRVCADCTATSQSCGAAAGFRRCM